MVSCLRGRLKGLLPDRKSTRLNSSHLGISYAVFCLKKKNPITFIIVTNAALRANHARPRTTALTPPISTSVHRPPLRRWCLLVLCRFFFFFNDPATTEIYPLSLPDALPISYRFCRTAARRQCPPLRSAWPAENSPARASPPSRRTVRRPLPSRSAAPRPVPACAGTAG